MCPRARLSLASIELEEWKNEIVFFKNLTEKKIISFGKSESEEIMVTHVGRHFG